MHSEMYYSLAEHPPNAVQPNKPNRWAMQSALHPFLIISNVRGW